VPPALLERIREMLAELDAAEQLGDLSLPGYDLHPLKGDRKGTWAISVSGNWRLTFQLHDGQIWDLDLEDYH